MTFSLTSKLLFLQILDSHDFEEFPVKLLDSVQIRDSLIATSQDQLISSGLEGLGQHLELELGLNTGTRADSGSGLGLDLGTGAEVESSFGAGLDFASGVCIGAGVEPAAGIEVSPLDPEAQRRLSLQEPQTPLDSRTPQRHSSDPGGS